MKKQLKKEAEKAKKKKERELRHIKKSSKKVVDYAKKDLFERELNARKIEKKDLISRHKLHKQLKAQRKK